MVLSSKQLLQLGARDFAEGKTMQADSIFRQVLVSDPKNVDALYNLGAIAERNGDFVSALGRYRAALQLKPNDAELKQALASIQGQLSKQGKSKPLVGSARLDKTANQPQLAPQYGTFGSQPNLYLQGPQYSNGVLLPTQNSMPPVLTVTQNTPPQTMVTQSTPPQGEVKQNTLQKARKLLNALPEPLHCPICGFLRF
jgi:tetratricopeptide (TPR) repeat protein